MADAASSATCVDNNYTARWFRSSVRLPNQAPALTTWKAVVFSDQEVYWSISDVLCSLLGSRRKGRIDVSKEIRKSALDWEMWCAALGLPFELMLSKSKRAVSAKPEDDATDYRHVTDDMLLTTWGLLVLLGFWSSQRRALSCRQTGQCYLRMLVEALVPPSISSSLLQWGCHFDMSACMQGVLGTPCVHAAAILAPRGNEDPLDACVRVISGLTGQYTVCEQSRQWLGATIIPGLAGYIAAVARAGGDHFDGDALQHPRRVDHRGCRMPVATEYKVALRESILKKRKCQSQRQVASTHGIAEGSVRKWLHHDLRGVMNACWRLAGEVEDLGPLLLKQDGARLGQPARETVHYRASVPSLGLTTFMAPQDRPIASG